jgi:AmiR/NasT family two-component response regulator
MERHGVSDREAFEMLRTEARSNNRRVYDVAVDVA